MIYALDLPMLFKKFEISNIQRLYVFVLEENLMKPRSCPHAQPTVYREKQIRQTKQEKTKLQSIATRKRKSLTKKLHRMTTLWASFRSHRFAVYALRPVHPNKSFTLVLDSAPEGGKQAGASDLKLSNLPTVQHPLSILLQFRNDKLSNP